MTRPDVDPFSDRPLRTFFPRPIGHVAAVAMIVLTGVVGLTGTASAHPGHGITGAGDSAVHYLIEPAHAWGLGVLVTVSLAIGGLRIVRSWRFNAS